MRRLNTRQRFGFILGFYFFFWLVIFYFIFLVIFNMVVSSQFKKELLAESSDIIENHLVIQDNNLVFKRNQTGGSLKEYLITHNSAAVFLRADGKMLRTYGLFALGAAGVNQQEYIGKMVINPGRSDKYLEITIPWNGQLIKSLAVPLRAKGKTIGFVVIGKSPEEVNKIFNIMTMLFISLGVFSFIGSFAVGHILARGAFWPLRKMIGVMEKIEYDNLDTLLPIDGNPTDEVTRLSRKFNDMLSRLGDMAKRQKSFIANASHELKTPLARAISSLDILSQNKIDTKKEARLIREDLFEVNKLIDQLLFLTKIRKDIYVDKSRTIFLRDFFSRLEKKFEKQLRSKQLTLKIIVPEKADLLAPKEYLDIIFSNLLLNAIKYSHPRTSIYINSFKQDGRMVISVADEGIGMENEEVKRMFERFFRGKSSREEGYGIGLSLVKQICSLYNIGIKVVSKKGKGTTIYLYFS